MYLIDMDELDVTIANISARRQRQIRCRHASLAIAIVASIILVAFFSIPVILFYVYDNSVRLDDNSAIFTEQPSEDCMQEVSVRTKIQSHSHASLYLISEFSYSGRKDIRYKSSILYCNIYIIHNFFFLLYRETLVASHCTKITFVMNIYLAMTTLVQ